MLWFDNLSSRKFVDVISGASSVEAVRYHWYKPSAILFLHWRYMQKYISTCTRHMFSERERESWGSFLFIYCLFVVSRLRFSFSFTAGDMEFKQNKYLSAEKQIVTANPDINAVCIFLWLIDDIAIYMMYLTSFSFAIWWVWLNDWFGDLIFYDFDIFY